jgi:hypothetical protein
MKSESKQREAISLYQSLTERELRLSTPDQQVELLMLVTAQHLPELQALVREIKTQASPLAQALMEKLRQHEIAFGKK